MTQITRHCNEFVHIHKCTENIYVEFKRKGSKEYIAFYCDVLQDCWEIYRSLIGIRHRRFYHHWNCEHENEIRTETRERKISALLMEKLLSLKQVTQYVDRRVVFTFW